MAITNVWTWWWHASNNQDELARTLLTILPTVSILIWYLYMISTKKHLPPGPPRWPLLGNLPSLKPDLHEYLTNLAKRYGPIMSLKLGNKLVVIISSPSLAKSILKDQDLIFANRDVPVAAKIGAYGGQDVAWSQHGPTWRMLRRVSIDKLLSPASLDQHYEIRRSGVQYMVASIGALVGKPVDVGEQVFMSSFKIINSMLWGESATNEMGVEFKDLVGDLTRLLGMPNTSDFFPWLELFDLQSVQKEMRELMLRFDEMFNGAFDGIAMVKENGGVVKGFLGRLMKKKVEGGENTSLTITQMKALLMDMVLGATDTTHATTTWAIAELLQNPDIMKKAQEELDDVVGMENLIEESHLPKLVYLKAIIKEVLRLHPVLPFLVPHSPSSTCKIGDYIIPKDSRVMINVWWIHRDPSSWSDPLEFKPERFLISEPAAHLDFKYLPFGSGRRMCVGVNMAERMLGLTLGALLHSFEWSVPKGDKVDMSEQFGLVLKKATPLYAVPRPRLSGLN